MAQLVNIAGGLATALIGYLIGRLWRTWVIRRRYRRARRFWQPVVDGHFQIVISRFAVDGFREPTGLVGGGDAIANRLLGDLFQDIGLERPKSVYVDEPELDRNKNLILLGGANANRVVDEALARITPGLSVTDPGPGICMQIEDLQVPEDSAGGRRTYVAEPALDHMTDYGVIIRAHNPFCPDRALVVISGAYGYGTWAGVQVSQRPDFLKRCAELDAENHQAAPGPARSWSPAARLGLRSSELPDWAEVECLFKVDVIDRRPQTAEILLFRPIARSQRNASVMRSSQRAGSSLSG
jgi:hypothetical protein